MTLPTSLYTIHYHYIAINQSIPYFAWYCNHALWHGMPARTFIKTFLWQNKCWRKSFNHMKNVTLKNRKCFTIVERKMARNNTGNFLIILKGSSFFQSQFCNFCILGKKLFGSVIFEGSLFFIDWRHKKPLWQNSNWIFSFKSCSI